MKTPFQRAAPSMAIWAGASWLAGVLILVADPKNGVIDSIGNHRPWLAGIIGSVVAAAFVPILSRKKITWKWGAILGIPIGLGVLTALYFINPHSWQPTRLDAWKSTLLLFKLYPWVLLPVCFVAGAWSAHICQGNEAG